MAYATGRRASHGERLGNASAGGHQRTGQLPVPESDPGNSAHDYPGNDEHGLAAAHSGDHGGDHSRTVCHQCERPGSGVDRGHEYPGHAADRWNPQPSGASRRVPGHLCEWSWPGDATGDPGHARADRSHDFDDRSGDRVSGRRCLYAFVRRTGARRGGALSGERCAE